MLYRWLGIKQNTLRTFYESKINSSSAHHIFLLRTDGCFKYKFKNSESYQAIFSDHNSVKLQINQKGKHWKIHKYVKIKQHTTE